MSATRPAPPNDTDMSPSTHYEDVTPHDTNLFASGGYCRALWVGVFGDVSVERYDGTAVVFKNVQGILPVRAIRVNATDTTATDIVALY